MPISPKPTGSNWRKSAIVNPIEKETTQIGDDPIYGNVTVAQPSLKKESSTEDEGDRIEHDLLDLVEQEKMKEQQKSSPPALPIKTRGLVSTSAVKEPNLDFDIEPTTKLVHPSKNRKKYLFE